MALSGVEVEDVGEVSAVTPAPTIAPPTALSAATPKAMSGAIGERTYLCEWTDVSVALSVRSDSVVVSMSSSEFKYSDSS